MGRAMLLIVSGLILILGFIRTGISGTLRTMDKQGVRYAESIQARNIAYAGIERAMQEFNEDAGLAEPGYSKTFEFNPGKSKVDIDDTDCSEDDEPCRITLHSIGKFNDEHQGVRMTIEKKSSIEIPEFLTALGISTENFNMDFYGSTTLNGNDAGGECEPVPGVIVPPLPPCPGGIISGLLCSLVDLLFGGDNGGILGNPVGTAVADLIPFDPVIELVDDLEHQLGVQRLAGNYKGSLGSPEEPGVFFVESPTKLTGGIDEGYGIMVVRTPSGVEVGGDLSIAGNLTFHGLVIFENVTDITSTGTPNIRGTVMIGQREHYGQDTDISLGGNTNIQYDCSAREYAEKAVKNLVNAHSFDVSSVYEEGKIIPQEQI